ncbi:MAG TPA: BTAD domain-containing putative transcriptional regulator [Micromonosporaceae bacterium]|nr:BTAD domain-containing putative transcriptional regulator [Micromonosporaceae bacterium]
MEFRLLGAPELQVDGGTVDLGTTKQRIILAELLLADGKPLSVETLIDQTWDDRMPESSRNLVATYISRLRRILDRAAPGVVRISHRSGLYTLDCPPDAVDVRRFRALVAQARDTAGRDDHQTLDLYRQAMCLWRGPALAGLSGAWVAAAAATLDRERRDVRAGHIDLLLRLGRYDEASAELWPLVDEYPNDEGFAAQLLDALHAAGRTAEALRHYDSIRRRLADQLGVDPSTQLQESYLRLIRPDPPKPKPVSELPPAQLPADVPAFTGRTEPLGRLDELLEPGRNATTVVISAIDGTAGVGKTALAVHWGHRVRDHFPDGQLYVNLRGFDPGGSVVDPAHAVRGFLDALQVPLHRLPTDLDAQLALYRSLLAGRRILVLLDNARGSDQVRPLLPGEPGCLVVVTSRNQLTGLIATNAAQPLTLDLLSTVEAREFLARRLGADRIAAEPEAVDGIIAGCARLPLALAIVAAHAATRPQSTLDGFAAQLRDIRSRLDMLTSDDPATDVRAVFSWSYRALSPGAAALFRLLGLHPGPDISVAAAASLAALPERRLRSLLAELTAAHLLVEQTSGRYTLHDLLRAYAADQAMALDATDQRQAAVRRMLSHYLHTAYAADRILDPHRDPLVLGPVEPGTAVENLASDASASSWFVREQHVLLETARYADGAGWDVHAWQLAWALTTYLNRSGRWHDLVAVGRVAVAAAARLGEAAVQATAYRTLALAHIRLEQLDEAETAAKSALDKAIQADDTARQAHAHSVYGSLCDLRGRREEALRSAIHALNLYEQAGHRAGVADTLNNVGWCHAQLGDYRQAIDFCQRAVAIHLELTDLWGQAISLDSLGYCHRQLGEHDDAIAHHRQALDLYQALGDRYFQADTLVHIGEAHHAAGDCTTARTAYQQALEILVDLDHPDAERVRATLAAV